MPRIAHLMKMIFAAGLMLITFRASADTAAEILKKVDEIGHTKSTRMKVVQTVITPSGDKRVFKMLSYSANGNDRTLTVYVEPNQVRGMKILTLNEGDDIWTYFPRTNRTRKIASSARNRRVQGSDFTYDDMAQGKMSKDWSGTTVGNEKISGKSCYKLEVKPTKSGPKSYSKATAWIEEGTYLPIRIDYFDLDGEKLKRLELQNYKTISGVPVPYSYTMTNLLDGGKTLMKVAEAEINVKLDSALFTEAGLSK